MGSTLVNVGTIPVGSLTSDAPNNVACEGDDVLFTAGTGAANWFEFIVNNASQGQVLLLHIQLDKCYFR